MNKSIQISIAQLDNYGPWTVTPKNKPEAYLQMLQTRLFADLEEEISKRGGLVFLGRFDNSLAVTNGISLEEHNQIQKKLGDKYPVTVSFGVGYAEKSYDAQELASRALQEKGSSQSSERSEVLAGKCLNNPEESSVQIAHIDINRATKFTDTEPLFDTYCLIQEVYVSLSKAFSDRGALVFYNGGDNFMAPSNSLDSESILDALLEVEDERGVGLKAGVGCAPEAVEAARLASEGLHDIRGGKTDKKVFFKKP